VHDSYLCRVRMLRLGSCLALAVLAVVVLSACGGSSKSSSSTGTSTVAKAATGGTSSGPAGQTGKRRRELEIRGTARRECLQKNGVKLPKGTTGLGLPKGVTRAQYEAALKKCGGGLGGRGNLASNPAFKQAFAKFATCMRENGVNFPAPNTSGKGPVFSAKGVDTKSTAFRAASTKCRSVLSTAFRSASKASRPPGGAPPAAGVPGGAGATGQAKPTPKQG